MNIGQVILIPYTSSATTAVALSAAPTRKAKLLSVTAHASASVSDALTITLNSGNGAAYDTLLFTTTVPWTDVLYDQELIIEDGDSIDIACAEAGGTITKSVEVILQELST